jgi:hypothetical protein
LQREGFFLDYEKLDELATAQAPVYRDNKPFPHVALDDFISDELLEILLKGFPPPDPELQTRDNTAYANEKPVQKNKIGIRTDLLLDSQVRLFLWELQSQSFIRFLEKLTGIRHLLPDPSMRGGGTHQTLPGGMLQLHADFNIHPDYQLDRRINLLLYLNKDWKEEYGGVLELWDKDLTCCEKTIVPVAKRCVIFNTDSTSWHGHPVPVNTPDGSSRKSIALYYYTNGRPTPAIPHQTLWREAPKN